MEIILLVMLIIVYVHLEISLLYLLVLLVFPLVGFMMFIKNEIVETIQVRKFRRKNKKFNEYYHNK